MCVCVVCLCTWRPQKGVEYLGAGVTGIWKMPDLLHECWDLSSSLCDYAAHWAILQAPRFIFLDRKRSHDIPELFFSLILVMCTYMCLRRGGLCIWVQKPFRSQRLPWSCSSRCLCATWCGYWLPNSDPLREIQELLIAKPFPTAYLSFHLVYYWLGVLL